MNFISAIKLLKKLNREYVRLHWRYENRFWEFYMLGGKARGAAMNAAQKKLHAFRGDPRNSKLIREALRATRQAAEIDRLAAWRRFFELYQSPPKLKQLRARIARLESKIHTDRLNAPQGYRDPQSGRYIPASENKMRMILRTHPDEKTRRAVWAAMEKLARPSLADYVRLVGLRNEYARGLGYSDFYEYKAQTEEGMSKAQIFGIFGKIYRRTKYGFRNLRRLEKKMSGLRQPWNQGFLLAGDFTRDEDPYFNFGEALMAWGKSLTALGVDFRGGALQLDLLDRRGKYNNGFCHWPRVVHYVEREGRKGKRKVISRRTGSANFTCNLVPGQVGAGSQGLHTLFHEGGHAAHLLNADQLDAILNTEYPPASTAWDETQSMFMDNLASSIEWKTRYARNSAGEPYPWALFERKARKLRPVAPLDLMGIMHVADFERQVYAAKNLTAAKVVFLAKAAGRKYFDYRTDTLRVLNVPHIYSWESACAYHGYALAELAVAQWREYFYRKYGYLVDNPRVGREMKRVWQFGSACTFAECVQLATGRPLSAEAHLAAITRSLPQTLKIARQRIRRLARVPRKRSRVDLNANIRLVHGRQVVADNRRGFENMAAHYRAWLNREQ